MASGCGQCMWEVGVVAGNIRMKLWLVGVVSACGK